jgi:uncharacterized membrane protein
MHNATGISAAIAGFRWRRACRLLTRGVSASGVVTDGTVAADEGGGDSASTRSASREPRGGHVPRPYP